MKYLILSLSGLLTLTLAGLAQPPQTKEPQPPPWQFFDGNNPAKDSRYPLVDLYKSQFPFPVPASKEAWQSRRDFVRRQVAVAAGLWPLPQKTDLKPITGPILDRGDYTVQAVGIESLPGHIVTGNIYRPKTGGLHPVILCPHGHWNNARFHQATDAEVKKQLDLKAETDPVAAKHFLQAQFVTLARLGFIVFHYDMVGYCESSILPHREGFADAEAIQRLQSTLGLQTWNSIRALDYVLTIPGADPKRVGVTGASGGATQTFLLSAVDDRVQVIFPAVMVSTAMQGGCVCENAPLLRVGTGNVELAALHAPKPLAMSGANDWTIELERKGLPELKKLYTMLESPDNVAGKVWPEFPHNYNKPARLMMYAWMCKHFFNRTEPVEEKPFTPATQAELSLFHANNPRPAQEAQLNDVRAWWTAEGNKALAKMSPADLRKAWQTLLVDVGIQKADELDMQKMLPEIVREDGTRIHRLIFGRKGYPGQTAALGLVPKGYKGKAVLWLHPDGKQSLFAGGEIHPLARRLLDQEKAILTLDMFDTGERKNLGSYKVDTKYPGYTFGYNRSILANQVYDAQSALGLLKFVIGPKELQLVALGDAAPAGLIIAAVNPDRFRHVAIQMDAKWRWQTITDVQHRAVLPGAVRYGDARVLWIMLGGETAKRFDPDVKPEVITDWLAR